ncbi:MAG: peroxynitrite isomerase [Mycobacterium sp.]
MVDLHPAVAVLAPLLGAWAGSGTGEYPTIATFGYSEAVTFGHIGKPFLAYSQRTRAVDDSRPLHAETGYIRVPEPGRVEWLLAHPTGIVEVLEGPLNVAADGTLSMELTATVTRSSSAKEVTALARTFTLGGDHLSYTVRMAAVGLPLQHHLAAVLRRDPS